VKIYVVVGGVEEALRRKEKKVCENRMKTQLTKGDGSFLSFTHTFEI
jgi:hypothetical protein